MYCTESTVFQKSEPAASLSVAEAETRSSRGTPVQGPPPKPPRMSSASLNPFGSDFEDDDDNNDDGISLNSSRRSVLRYIEGLWLWRNTSQLKFKQYIRHQHWCKIPLFNQLVIDIFGCSRIEVHLGSHHNIKDDILKLSKLIHN